MTFDFRQIVGSENSTEKNFSSLCSRLVMREYLGAKPVDGKGGDQGLDTFIGSFNGVCKAFQHKYFPDRVGSAQRKQIEDSLITVISKHDPVEWTLMLPIDLNPTEIVWFEKMKARYSPLPLDWWGKTKLQDLLGKYSDIARDFQPRPNMMVIVVKEGHDLKALTPAQIVETFRPVFDAATKTELPDDVIEGMAKEIRRGAKLKLLIWGPGPSHADLHAKRCEIRDSLRLYGHTADFSEDVWTPERLAASGLNLTHAEYLQAKAYDYIICLMASPGSIAEVHDFARDRRIARKMMVCVDQLHSDGYTAEGILRVFEGHNGKLDWFQTPTDLTDCHLATRVVNQVSKVSEAKQLEIAIGMSLS